MMNVIPAIVKEIRETIPSLSAVQAYKDCQNNHGIILDVREPAETEQSKTKNSVNIPRGLLEMKMLELYPNVDLPIYVHCASGVRATFAAEQLKRVGYKKVTIITCGLSDIPK